MTEVQTQLEQEPTIVQQQSPGLTAYTKSWVRRFILMSFLNFIIAGTIALFMRTDQASLSNLLGPIGTPGVFGQLETAHGLGMFVGWQFPFTYGLCFYIIPKYMKRKIYHESLLPWIFYTFFAGFYLVWLSTLYGYGPGWYFFFPLPLSGAPGGSVPWDLYSAFVFFIGMILTNISLAIFVIVGFGTVFSTKYNDYFDNAPGKINSLAARLAAATGFVAYMPKSTRARVVEIPVAVIGVVVTMFDMIISLPPFMALLIDGAWSSLGNPPELSNLVAQNFVWLNYHPIVYFAFFPLVGMYYTLIPIFAKRVFQSSFWVRAPWPLLLIPGVGVYSHHLFLVTIQPTFLQFMSTYMTMIIALGSGISVFTLMGLIWRSKYDWNLTARWIAAAIVGWVLGGIMGTELGNPSFDVYGHNTYMVLAHFHYNALCGIVLAAFGFLYWAFPEFTNKKWYSSKLSEIHFWMMIVGAFGMVSVFAVMGYLGVPRREFAPIIPVLPFTDMYSPWLILAEIFAFVIAASLVFFIINVIKSLQGPALAPDHETPMPAPEMDVGVPGAVTIMTEHEQDPPVRDARDEG